MSSVLAIDPGPKFSAWIVMRDGALVRFDKMDNQTLIEQFGEFSAFLNDVDHLAIEMVESFGMAVGAEVFETVFWVGRFVEAAGIPFTRVYRKEVKMHLCHSMRAKDGNIRQAIIDRYGGESAIGRKKNPGPLYGVSGDVWSALAVALTWSDKNVTVPQC